MPQPDIVSAGAVTLRKGTVLLVHRPKYDDWSFPKGKRDRGEHLTACAVREVREETGLDVRLGRPLTQQHYPVGRRQKVVHYWVARVIDDHDVSSYSPNAEIDAVAWVPVAEAARRLSYAHDRETLAEALAARKRTRTVVVLRHASSRARSRWKGDDRLRPLLATGERQGAALAPVLAAYDVRRLVSSSSVRCRQTLEPYGALSGREIEAFDALSEEAATPAGVLALVSELVDDPEPVVVCTHRPVLPEVFASLGVDPPALEKGEMLVLHLRRGAVVATERH